MKNIDEIRYYLIEEINWNKLMSKKHKNVYRVLNYIERLLILISIVSGYVSISAFASSVSVPIGITSSGIGLETCVITAGIKKYKSIITVWSVAKIQKVKIQKLQRLKTEE